jgi:hypothetical protein
MVASIFLGSGVAAAAPVNVTGGTAQQPVDLTSYLIANEDLALGGGFFVVTIPVAGAPGTVTGTAAIAYAPDDLTSYGAGHFLDPAAPVIVYRGVIAGSGALRVTNATEASTNPSTDPTAPQASRTFDGGALLFTNPQTFASGTADPSLTIDPNTTVAFDTGKSPDLGGSLVSTTTTQRNVVNNGYLYSYGNNAWGDIISTGGSAGVVTFESGNVMSDGSTYSGGTYVLNGAHVRQNATLSTTNLVQSNIFSFETQGLNYLVGPTAPTYKSVYSGTYYSAGADTQIQGAGIQVFTGLELSVANQTKKDFLPPEQSRLFDYFVHSYGGFGLVFYIQATMQLGDGEAIVDNGDGTNNVFIQANIGSVFISTGNFEKIATSVESAYLNQAIGFDYSGTYHYDACVNVVFDTANALAGRVEGGNFVVMNPDPGNTGKAPNHLVLTCPMMTQGIVQVDPNAILQLGDGTLGNSAMKTVTYAPGKTYTGVYSDSYGNGSVLTRLGSPSAYEGSTVTAAYDEIIDNGQIIVDNSPGALDITTADTTLGAFEMANQLDTIVGSGSVEQMGTLPLTLDGVNSYTGGTLIDPGATLIVASATALGSSGSTVADGGVAAGGDVINHGVLTHSASAFLINVPGNYDQGGSP